MKHKLLTLCLLLEIISNPRIWHEYSEPFQVRYFHGINETCESEYKLNYKLFSDYNFRCIETSKGIFVSFEDQIKLACDNLMAEIDLLENGFTIYGNSQGGLIARAVIQSCPVGKYVKRFITYASPHNGVGSLPRIRPGGVINWLFLSLCGLDFFKRLIGPCAYIRNRGVGDIGISDGQNEFLRVLNNVKLKNEKFRTRILGLEVFMSIWHESDTMVQPANSGAFGYFGEQDKEGLFQLEGSIIWRKDTLGLRKMFEENRFFRCVVKGDHTELTYNDFYLLVRDFLDFRKPLYQGNYFKIKDICVF